MPFMGLFTPRGWCPWVLLVGSWVLAPAVPSPPACVLYCSACGSSCGSLGWVFWGLPAPPVVGGLSSCNSSFYSSLGGRLLLVGFWVLLVALFITLLFSF